MHKGCLSTTAPISSSKSTPCGRRSRLSHRAKQQIAEAQKLYQDLNKLTDIPQLAQQLKSDALRELDISGGSLEGFGNGNLDVVGAGRAKADAVYRDLLKQLGLCRFRTHPAPPLISTPATSAFKQGLPRTWAPLSRRERKGSTNCAAGWPPQERRRKWLT